MNTAYNYRVDYFAEDDEFINENRMMVKVAHKEKDSLKIVEEVAESKVEEWADQFLETYDAHHWSITLMSVE